MFFIKSRGLLTFSIHDLLKEESFRDLFDHAHDLIQLISVEGKILYVNKSWTTILEYSLEEIQGQLIYSIIAEPDKERFARYRENVIKGVVHDKEITVCYKTKSGRNVFVEGFVSVRKKNGVPLYTRGIFRDITARLHSEALLKEREYNLQQILLNAPDAIVVINQQSFIKFWNPQAEKLFEWTAEEVQDKQLSSFIIPHRYRDAHRKGMERYLATGEANVLNKTIEITALNKSGEEFYVSLTISTTKQNGETAFIAFIRDIREQKKNLAELEKKKKELESSNKELQQFAHVASHDMKEPIRKIQVFGELLQQQLNEDTGIQYLHKISSAAQRLKQMVEGVLKYATISRENTPFEVVDLNQVMKNIETDMEVLLRQKNALLHYNSLPCIHGVSFLIYQLFYNLINNSLKFSRKNIQPEIEITATFMSEADTGEGFTKVVVRDNGIGFDAAFAIKIFHAFTRLNRQSEYEGTGLGLSLCKSIMERHNGSIAATGTEGEGAIFTMIFPAFSANAN